MMGKCGFCGEEKEVGIATPFHVNYCVDCMRMNIEYDKESISKMKTRRKKRITEARINQLEKQKDEALKALMNFH